jgi:hypothetical protein
MTTPSSRKAFALFAVTVAVAVLATTQLAHAAGLFADQDVDPRFKAKIMKEKVKQNAEQAKNFSFAGASADPQCGSQSIGNVDTGGRIGTAPREVFVFAPNAVNLVSGPGCK